MSERWRSIKNYPMYEVSDRGRVRSLPRKGSDGRRWKGRILKQCGHKYPTVQLSFGKTVHRYVHHLVLETFRGPCPPGKEACHNDGDPWNCRLSNLRWDTRSANALDVTRHGKRQWQRGERMGCSKLTEADVRAIRAEPKATQRQLGDAYGVHYSTIGNIIRRVSWKHID